MKVFENEAVVVLNHGDKVFVKEHSPEYVAVVLYDHGCLYLVKQFRSAVGKPTLELPGGRIEKGEAPEEAARRELREELGYLGGELKYVGAIDSYACLTNRMNHFFFCGEIGEFLGTAMDDDEDIETVKLDADSVREGLKSGLLCDSELLAGLALCESHGLLNLLRQGSLRTEGPQTWNF